MLNKVLNVFTSPIPFYKELSRNLWYILIFSIFIPVFMIVFQPFGLANVELPNESLALSGFGLIAFFVLIGNQAFFPRMLPNLFRTNRWNLGRELVWELLNFFMVVLISATYWAQVLEYSLNLQLMWELMKSALVLAVILIPFCAMVSYISRAFPKRGAAFQKPPSQVGDSDFILLKAESGHETVQAFFQDLLYIQACENYVRIVQKNGNANAEVLLRSSLKNIERQLPASGFFRCHRSFIVNLANAASLEGNKRQSYLILKDRQFKIPVSRAVLEDLKNEFLECKT